MNMKQVFAVGIAMGATMLLAACKPEADAPNPTSVTAQPTLKFIALDVGKTINTDRSVSPLTMFRAGDEIIASVRTDGVSKNVPISTKLVAMKNGQALGELSQKITTTGPATTNLKFPKSTTWELGRYLVEVTINGKFEARQEIEVRQDGPPNSTPPKDAP